MTVGGPGSGASNEKKPSCPPPSSFPAAAMENGNRVSRTTVSWEFGLQMRRPHNPWHLANWQWKSMKPSVAGSNEIFFFFIFFSRHF